MAIKRMKIKPFKMNTAVLTALKELECCPYGNTEIRVETAPVPVEHK
jgi:hypothetical protein